MQAGGHGLVGQLGENLLAGSEANRVAVALPQRGGDRSEVSAGPDGLPLTTHSSAGTMGKQHRTVLLSGEVEVEFHHAQRPGDSDGPIGSKAYPDQDDEKAGDHQAPELAFQHGRHSVRPWPESSS